MAFDGQKQLDGLRTYLDTFKPSVEKNLKPGREDIYSWRSRSPTRSPVREN